jgi:hypothetical protein
MKWIFKRGLLAAPAIIFYSLLSFNVCSVSGCKTPSSPPELRLSAKSSTDSTGPKVTIRTVGNIPAGSSFVLGCDSPGCKLILSTDTTGYRGGVKLLNLGTTPVDIPDNTVLELRVIRGGDSAAMVK